MPDLTSPDALLFATPVALALIVWLLSLTGLFGHEAGDAGDTAGLGDGHDGGGLTGGVPLVLALSILLFVFGWTGLALRFWAGLPLVVSIAGAAVGGLGLTRLAGRALAPLFATASAPSGTRLVGRVGVVSSETVSDDFGTATVRVDGTRIDVPVRLAAPVPREAAPAYGSRVLLFEYDGARGVYVAAPHTDD